MAQLEALLLLHTPAESTWSVAMLAKRFYISVQDTAGGLAQMDIGTAIYSPGTLTTPLCAGLLLQTYGRTRYHLLLWIERPLFYRLNCQQHAACPG